MRRCQWAFIGLAMGLLSGAAQKCAGDEFESWGQIGAVAAMNELWEVKIERR